MEHVLSLCIPTYNRSQLLQEALQAIAVQWEDNFTTRIEIIVSDNASTDDTPQVLRRFAQEHPQIHLQSIRSPENRGPDANIYRVASLAHGEFVYLLSDDDILLPGAVSRLFQLIKDYPTFDAYALNVRSFAKSVDEISPGWLAVSEDKIIHDRNEALDMLRPAYMSAMAFRRSLVADKDYTDKIGTYLIQSYLFTDVLANEKGVYVTKDAYVAQRRDNTGGWPFWEVMTTNLRDWLAYGEQRGFSKEVTSRVLMSNLKAHLFSATLHFKLRGRESKLMPKSASYSDGIRRVFQVYGPHPFVLFVLVPLMLTPSLFVQQARWLYKKLKPRRPAPAH